MPPFYENGLSIVPCLLKESFVGSIQFIALIKRRVSHPGPSQAVYCLWSCQIEQRTIVILRKFNDYNIQISSKEGIKVYAKKQASDSKTVRFKVADKFI